jgi:hypothetical protein
VPFPGHAGRCFVPGVRCVIVGVTFVTKGYQKCPTVASSLVVAHSYSRTCSKTHQFPPSKAKSSIDDVIQAYNFDLARLSSPNDLLMNSPISPPTKTGSWNGIICPYPSNHFTSDRCCGKSLTNPGKLAAR